MSHINKVTLIIHQQLSLSLCVPFLTVQLSPVSQCEGMMANESSGASRTVLLSLFWALQASLISWCYLQLKGGAFTAVATELARDILLKCEICDITASYLYCWILCLYEQPGSDH